MGPTRTLDSQYIYQKNSQNSSLPHVHCMKQNMESDRRVKKPIKTHEISMKKLAERPCGAKEKTIKTYEIVIKMPAESPCGAKQKANKNWVSCQT